MSLLNTFPPGRLIESHFEKLLFNPIKPGSFAEIFCRISVLHTNIAQVISSCLAPCFDLFFVYCFIVFALQLGN